MSQDVVRGVNRGTVIKFRDSAEGVSESKSHHFMRDKELLLKSGILLEWLLFGLDLYK